MSWAFPLFILPHNYRLRQTIEAPQKKGDGCPPPSQTLPQQPHLGSLINPQKNVSHVSDEQIRVTTTTHSHPPTATPRKPTPSPPTQKKGDGCPPPLQTLPQQPHLGSLTKPTPTRRETVARLPHKLYPKAKP